MSYSVIQLTQIWGRWMMGLRWGHWGLQSIQHSIDGMLKAIPFNDNTAFWSKIIFVMKLTYVFFQALIFFSSKEHIIQWINAPASCEHKLDFQFLTYGSTSIRCMKPVGLIPIQFTGLATYFIHPPKFMHNESVHQVYYCVQKSTAIT